jgi:hypothetical protein
MLERHGYGDCFGAARLAMTGCCSGDPITVKAL